MQVCAANAQIPDYFVVKVLFDACWLLAVEGSTAIRRENFIANWGLIEGTFPPGAPDAIEVFYLNPLIWEDIKAFRLTPEASCPDGCIIREFSG